MLHCSPSFFLELVHFLRLFSFLTDADTHIRRWKHMPLGLPRFANTIVSPTRSGNVIQETGKENTSYAIIANKLHHCCF